MSLLQTMHPQPGRHADAFGVPQDTPVNNPWFSDYWDTYAGREAAFQNPPGQFGRYAQAPDPAPEPQVGVAGALAANSDVYGPRRVQAAAQSPDSAPFAGGAPVGGPPIDFNKDFNFEMPGMPSSQFGGLDLGSGLLGQLDGFGYNTMDDEDKGPLSGAGSTAQTIGRGAGWGAMFGATGLLGVEAAAGLAEREALNAALAKEAAFLGIAAPTLSIWDALKTGFNPFQNLRDRGYQALDDQWNAEHPNITTKDFMPADFKTGWAPASPTGGYVDETGFDFGGVGGGDEGGDIGSDMDDDGEGWE